MNMNGQKIVDLAFKEVGVVEYPKNSNKTKYGEWFGYNGVAWCAIFVSWVYSQAGFPLKKMGYTKGFAGCRPALKLFRERGEVVEVPTVGDIVFFDWEGDEKSDHVGIFNGWANKERTQMYTIEGNTSKTNQSNGGQVMSRTRSIKGVVFIHPKVLD